MTTPDDATARPHLRFATTRLQTGLQVQYAEQGDPTGQAIAKTKSGWRRPFPTPR